MMTKVAYKEFIAAVLARISDYLPEKYADYVPEIRQVKKVNCIKDALTFSCPHEKGTHAVPILYLDGYYQMYLDSPETAETGLKPVIRAMASDFCCTAAEADEARVYVEAGNAEIPLNNLYYTLINKDANKELLEEVPHRDFLDLAVVYRIALNDSERGRASYLITDKIAEARELTEEVLYEASTRNAQTPTVQSMEEVLAEMGVNFGTEEMGLYVVTNTSKLNGSTALLDTELFHKISMEKFGGGNLIILPSSIHEVLVLAADTSNQNVSDFAAMVFEINREQVAVEERLSDNVYRYDAALNKIVLATNVETGLVA